MSSMLQTGKRYLSRCDYLQSYTVQDILTSHLFTGAHEDLLHPQIQVHSRPNVSREAESCPHSAEPDVLRKMCYQSR